MARTWLSVTVELLGGRGEELWPWPGRVFAVGPSHTFGDLARAIDDAFGRWDRAHLSLFTLADGRVVTDEQIGQEVASNPFGRVVSALDVASAKVGRMLSPGAEFQYTFDLGDEWVHRCTVGEHKIDPLDELGIVPDKPLPYWGWGSIPDQYGRNWSGDDGESPMPKRPRLPHPMQTHQWPSAAQAAELALQSVRVAAAANDPGAFLDALAGREIDDALQQLGPGMAMALHAQHDRAEPVALSLVNRLTVRDGPGDRVLAEDLLALLRGEPSSAPALFRRSRRTQLAAGRRLRRVEHRLRRPSDGRCLRRRPHRPALVGEDVAIDVDEEPDRWAWLKRSGSRERWEDMEAFAQRQRDHALRERLTRAIEGAGAFRRFRALVHDEGVVEQWRVFSDDRSWGRAREALADAGIRVL